MALMTTKRLDSLPNYKPKNAKGTLDRLDPPDTEPSGDIRGDIGELERILDLLKRNRPVKNES
jgi:hypothetical protein